MILLISECPSYDLGPQGQGTTRPWIEPANSRIQSVCFIPNKLHYLPYVFRQTAPEQTVYLFLMTVPRQFFCCRSVVLDWLQSPVLNISPIILFDNPLKYPPPPTHTHKKKKKQKKHDHKGWSLVTSHSVYCHDITFGFILVDY